MPPGTGFALVLYVTLVCAAASGVGHRRSAAQTCPRLEFPEHQQTGDWGPAVLAPPTQRCYLQ